MRVDLFDFELPEDRIALRPAAPRDAARLLVVEPGRGLTDATVRDLPGLLKSGDCLVLNDTRVINAALGGERLRGGGRLLPGKESGQLWRHVQLLILFRPPDVHDRRGNGFDGR